MRAVIYSADPETRAALRRLVTAWMRLACAELDVAVWDRLPEAPADRRGGIFFLDAGALPPAALEPLLPARKTDCALFLCARDPRAAIDCYALHPTGLLAAPPKADDVWQAMDRCVELWWGTLRRLELMSDRVKVQIPLYDLVWAESVPKGCLLHRTHSQTLVRLPLSALEALLPPGIFVRCQRSFLVNLCHAAQAAGGELILSDGTRLPLGRKVRERVIEAYEAVRSARAGSGARSKGAYENDFCCDL